MCPETLENYGPEGPTWRQNGSKMAPWTPLGDPWAPTLLPEAPRSPPGGALGRPGGPHKFVVGGLGASWGEKLVDFSAPGGPREAAGGSRGGSGRPFWRHFCSRALRDEKSDKLRRFSTFLAVLFGCFLFRFLRLPGGAGARAHLEKTGFRMEGVAFFAYPAFARGAKKRRNFEEKQLKNNFKTHRKTNAETQAKNIKQ